MTLKLITYGFLFHFMLAVVTEDQKIQTCHSQVLGKFLWHVEDAASVATLKIFKKYKNYPNIAFFWSHFKANCMWIPEMAPADVFLIQKLNVDMYIQWLNKYGWHLKMYFHLFFIPFHLIPSARTFFLPLILL